MQERELCVVVGDAGAALDLGRPVEIVAERSGIAPKWTVDSGPQSRAARVLEQQKIPYTMDIGPVGYPKVILVGTSTKAIDAQLAWTEYGRMLRRGGAETYVVWYEDLFANSVYPKVMAVDPHAILTINELARKIVAGRRPDTPTAAVGKPTFGPLPSVLDTDIRGARARRRIGLSPEDFLIVFGFAGEPAHRAPAQLEAILGVKDDFPKDAVCAFRFHPAHPQSDELWERARASGLRTVDARKENLSELYLAACPHGAVVTDYVSTDAYRNVLLGTPTIITLFPEDREYRIELGYIGGVPPILTADQSWGAENAEHMLALIHRVNESPIAAGSYMQQVCAEPFRLLLEPGSAEYLAGVLLGFLLS